MEADTILSEIEGTVNKITKDYFIDFLNTEGTGQKENYLFYYDFITDNIPHDLIFKLLGISAEYYFSIDEIVRHKALESYKEPTNEEIIYYKVFNKDIKPSEDLKEIQIPLDKANNTIWDKKAAIKKYGGFIPEEIITANKGTEEETAVIIRPNFDLVKESWGKELTPFDKRIYTVISALYASGQKYITLIHLCKECGCSYRKMNEIRKSLLKMSCIMIEIDNKSEIEAGLKYPSFVYNSNLLSMEMMTLSLYGTDTTYIHLFNEPVLLRFARERGQYTTIPENIYKTSLTKTERNISLEDYLSIHILRLKKNEGLNRKLLFSTLCEKLDISMNRANRMQRNRLYKDVQKLLTDYRNMGYIKGYEIDQEKNITFILSEGVER